MTIAAIERGFASLMVEKLEPKLVGGQLKHYFSLDFLYKLQRETCSVRVNQQVGLTLALV